MRDIFREVTDQIIAELKTGVRPWVQPWSRTPGVNVAANAVSKHEYRGINRLLLLAARWHGWPQPRFLTFGQARAAGGHVQKGSRGFRVVFFGNAAEKKADNADDEDTPRKFSFLKSFVVFNIAQCEGLPDSITKPVRGPNYDRRDALIDEFIAATGATILEKYSEDKAYYNNSSDCIVLPRFEIFRGKPEYYATMFHELVHWSGHKSRLDRQLGERFGRFTQAAEELVAELGAAFLCAEFSVDGFIPHAAYLEHYLKLLQNDTKAIFTAASKAQTAVDFLREQILKEPDQTDLAPTTEVDGDSNSLEVRHVRA